MKPSLETFAKAAYGNNGNINLIAKTFHKTRQTVHNWVKADKEFSAIIDDSRETLKDFAESMLVENIKAKKEASIFFYLKTQCKDRGYSENEDYVKTVDFEEDKEKIEETLSKVRHLKGQYNFLEESKPEKETKETDYIFLSEFIDQFESLDANETKAISITSFISDFYTNEPDIIDNQELSESIIKSIDWLLDQDEKNGLFFQLFGDTEQHKNDLIAIKSLINGE